MAWKVGRERQVVVCHCRRVPFPGIGSHQAMGVIGHGKGRVVQSRSVQSKSTRGYLDDMNSLSDR